MSFIKFHYFVLTLMCAVRIKAQFQCGIRKHSFIPLVYHGWKVEEGQWPWHVGLLHKSLNETKYACGGTLIDPKYVLTAAHCVVNQRNQDPLPKGNILLHFGQNDLAMVGRQVQMMDIESIHVHPQFSKHRNDIAMLKLRLPVELTEYVIPICLDMQMDEDLRNLEGQRGWITGWGTTQNGTRLSELRSASLPVLSYLECFQDEQTLFGSLLNKNVFCAGDRNGTSPGTGDSGGGMYFCEGDRWVLRGIVSFAKVDETRLRVDSSKYAVFVNVQRFLPWIREKIEEQSSNPTALADSERISVKDIEYCECEPESENFVQCFASQHQPGMRWAELQRSFERSNSCCVGNCVGAQPNAFQVSLVSSGQAHECTGILVNENHVLTACHCGKGGWTHHSGTANIGDISVSYSNFTCHPRYSRPLHSHDIAIVRLDSPVQLSYNLIPACLASNRSENLYDTLLVTGFLRKSLNSTVRHFYQSDANKVAVIGRCQRYDPNIAAINPAAHLCVINNDRLPTHAYGSAGSPMQTVNTWNCMSTVVGVLGLGTVSKTEGVRREQDIAVGVFSRVAYHLDWIEEIVWGAKSVAQTTTEALRESSTTTTVNSLPSDDLVLSTD